MEGKQIETALALSVRQPWASMLFLGKDVENRKWQTAVRGRVWIHASSRLTPPDEYEEGRLDLEEWTGLELPPTEVLPRGAILGSVEIVDCVRSSASPWFDGPFGFVLAVPQRLEVPVPCRGALGFWSVPLDLRGQLAGRFALKRSSKRAPST